MRYRPLAKLFFVIFVVNCLALGWCGGQNPANPVYQSGYYERTITYKAADGQEATHVVQGVKLDDAELHTRAFKQDIGGAFISETEIREPFKFTVETFSQLLTLYYFAFFLVILPVLGLIERPTRMPDSVSDAVLSRPVAAE